MVFPQVPRGGAVRRAFGLVATHAKPLSDLNLIKSKSWEVNKKGIGLDPLVVIRQNLTGYL